MYGDILPLWMRLEGILYMTLVMMLKMAHGDILGLGLMLWFNSRSTLAQEISFNS
jgi:hypothetical protein